jgi:hypothetical protein
MTILVISLVAGPFLFIAPSVYAGNVKPPKVIVIFEGYEYDPNDPDPPIYEYVQEDYALDGYTLLDKTRTYTVDVSNVKYYGDGDSQGIVTVLLYIPNRYQSKYGELELGVIQYGVKADVNDDGIVTGEDISLIAGANSQPDLYEWEYDLAAPWGVITNEDVNTANTFKNEQADWIDLGIGTWVPIEEWDRYYLAVQVDHLSGFGIRR